MQKIRNKFIATLFIKLPQNIKNSIKLNIISNKLFWLYKHRRASIVLRFANKSVIFILLFLKILIAKVSDFLL